MQIEKDKVVQFHYTLNDADGSQLETTAGGDPIAYLHGHNNIFAKVETEFEGKVVGDKVSITLEPQDGYGMRNENAEQRVPVKHLGGPKNKKWKQGEVAVVHTEQGRRQVTVVKMGKFMVTVDTNHPYAGKTVTFDCEIADIRDATGEEIAHGHAHGVGGHHH